MKLSTRRRLCRLIFCLACALPTLLVGTAIVVLRTPMYRAAQIRSWQMQLSAELGLDVRLADITSCGGSRWLATGLECRDPASDEWLIRVRSADLAETTRGWLVSLGQPQVNSLRLSRLADLLHEHVLRRADSQAAPIQLAASALELTDGSRSASVLDVRSELRASPEEAELLLEFRASNAAEDQRVRMRFARQRQLDPQLDPPVTRCELQTGEPGLPCSVAMHWLPALGQLGDECVFQGSAWCEQHPAGWKAELQGVFRQVDLELLVTRQFPHKLSGSAVLSLTRCKLHAGRVTEAEGRLSCEEGVVSQSLLDAAERSLTLQQHRRGGDADPLQYRQLAVDFRLSAAGLDLAAPQQDRMTLMAAKDGPLLSLRDTRPRSPLSLVHLLVPRIDLQVPATRETAALVRALPLPESSPVSHTARGGHYTPTRLE